MIGFHQSNEAQCFFLPCSFILSSPDCPSRHHKWHRSDTVPWAGTCISVSTWDSKGDGVPFGRKNPKKPAVSWQGIQRGQRPLGTRLCPQSLVCYTFARGWQRTACFARRARQKKAGAGCDGGAVTAEGGSLGHPRAKGYRFPSGLPVPSWFHLRPQAPCGITMMPWHQTGITLRHHS